MIAMLASDVREQLHAHANSQERRTAGMHFFFQRGNHAGDRRDAAHAIAKGTDTGEHHALGPHNLFGIRGDDYPMAAWTIGPRACERLLGGTQIPGAIIDERDTGHDWIAFGGAPLAPSQSGCESG